jgi:hypothetical protein
MSNLTQKHVAAIREQWAVLWRYENKLDGAQEHLIYDYGVPKLFPTRRQARYYIANGYSYIKTRPDLRAEPHGWKMPIPVRVEIKVKP